MKFSLYCFIKDHMPYNLNALPTLIKDGRLEYDQPEYICISCGKHLGDKI